MRPIRKTISPTALDRNGIAQAQSPSGAGSLTLNGALASGGTVTFTVPQHVTVYAPGVETTDTFTITGTDRTGAAMTEEITGVNAGTVAGTKNFLTVTDVSTDAAGTNIEVGVDGTCESEWLPMNHRTATEFNVGVGAMISTGATLTYALQYTFDDIQAAGFTQDGAATYTDATMTGETANSTVAFTVPCTAIRMAITAHTSGSLTVNVIQSGG